ncbi:hypothetical protein FNYG_05299 [Fusarium nygamai]|uniref:Amine oxidase n=1 Tax=Gibberella nygamai TaxID=42673 RepID=A0A2K0WG57_GIBNY|nr:hypothetical protein FNYG_05299 [Fusarium nygamai]
MYFPTLILLLTAGLEMSLVAAAKAPKNSTVKLDKCAATALTTEFSAGFKQPNPPQIKSEFTTSFVQHRWNQRTSVIVAGYLENSGSQGIIRVDQAYDGSLTSSVYDYNNMTDDTMVDHTMNTFQSGASCPKVSRGYDNITFPLFSKDMLIKGGAVFTGSVTRDFSGRGVGWNIIYEGRMPLTVYVNPCNAIIGYDYFLRDERTRVVTEFFNTNITTNQRDVLAGFALPAVFK